MLSFESHMTDNNFDITLKTKIMSKILIGKNSAIVGFAMFFVLIISVVTCLIAATAAFSQDVFLGVITLITLIVWVGSVVFSYRNFDKLKKGFSHEKE